MVSQMRNWTSSFDILRARINYDIKYRMGRESKEG
jgi:hypothetical protein